MRRVLMILHLKVTIYKPKRKLSLSYQVGPLPTLGGGAHLRVPFYNAQVQGP